MVEKFGVEKSYLNNHHKPELKKPQTLTEYG